ncbi:MAG: glycosyltransferase [Chitinophagaceae bacterium]
MKNRIIFLCNAEEETRERAGYASAFRSLGYEIVFVGDEHSFDRNINAYEDEIFCIIHPDPLLSFHTINLWNYDIPNIIFQFDTYTLVDQRIEASKPYDIQVVCHAGYANLYNERGCKNVITLPHCIDNTMFQKNDLKITNQRKLDIGWVGRYDAHFYKFRREVLRVLQSSNWNMNNPKINYSWREMFEIFLNSKAVVNASRDDFDCDANLRCFEAMGCGALLFTKLPSELSEFGYKDGIHFVGYETIDDLINKLDYYLNNQVERELIADRGKKITLEKHTYLNRCQAIINYINSHGNSIISANNFRNLTFKNKWYHIYFSHYKDANLKWILTSFFNNSFKNQILLLPRTLCITLRIIKRRLFN